MYILLNSELKRPPEEHAFDTGLLMFIAYTASLLRTCLFNVHVLCLRCCDWWTEHLLNSIDVKSLDMRRTLANVLIFSRFNEFGLSNYAFEVGVSPSPQGIVHQLFRLPAKIGGFQIDMLIFGWFLGTRMMDSLKLVCHDSGVAMYGYPSPPSTIIKPRIIWSLLALIFRHD